MSTDSDINHQKILSCVKIDPIGQPIRAIIWLHGLGADGHDFTPIVPELELPSTLGIRFIFPHAPIMPVTINQGYEMPAWFDIYSASIAAKIDNQGIANSIQQINAIIEAQTKDGITPNNIILAGFSQGAVIALATGLSFPEKLAGMIALSGYLPQAGELLMTASAANRTTPIFVGHGTEDPIVPYALGESTSNVLTSAGYPVAWHSYPMPHSVSPDEIEDIGKWIRRIWG